MLGLPLALFSFIATSLGHPTGAGESVAKRALLPSQDPFYAAPANLSDYLAGSIVRSRPFPGTPRFFNFPINLAATYQILYRTTGSLGEPLSTVTTILIPYNADFSKLLSYQVEIDSPWEGCFPSVVLQAGADIDDITARYSELFYLSALNQGWSVAVPDHDGPNGAFTAGLLSGHATLDNIRAVLQSQSITGIFPNATTTLWGYSGGALATEWAVEVQPAYAPELHLAGAAFGGTPANLSATVNVVNGGIAAGLFASAIVGLARAHPNLAAYVQQHLLPATSAQFEKVGTQCTVPNAIDFAYQNIFNYFDDGEQLLNSPMVQDTLYTDGLMGHTGIPQVPLYMYHSVNDELVPIPSVDALVENLCNKGVNIQYVRQTFGEHILVAILGAADAFRFLIGRMNGQPVEQGCSTVTDVSTSLDPSDIPILGDFVYNDLLALLGGPIGPLR